MADANFVIKNGLVVNGSFTANGSSVNAASISATALSIGVVSVNATTINVGTATINSTTFTGTSNDSTNLNGQTASFYTNATNISSGTLPAARLTGAYDITVSSANNASFLGGANAASYQTTAGLAANVATLTANNTTNLNGQAASYYTDIPSRLGYTPVNKAGDLTMTGDYSTSGSISVGRGEAGEKQLYFHNSSRRVYFVLGSDGNALGLWDATSGAARFLTDASRNFKVPNNVVAEGGIRFADTGEYSASFKFAAVNVPGNQAIGVLINGGSFDYLPRSTNLVRFRSTGDGQSPYLEYSDIAGNVFGARSFVSDANLKKNIQPVERDFIEAIKKIVPSSFDWKEGTPSSGHNSLGLIAQNVMEGIPEGASHVGESTNLSLNPIPLIAALIGAVKQQQKQIDDLKIQIATLQQV